MQSGPPDEKIGDATIRIRPAGGLYRGCILKGGKAGTIFEDADLAALQARLRKEAGKLHPDYIGMDGAIGRFLHFFPSGFADVAFLRDERDYKVDAQNRLKEVLPLDAAVAADAEAAIAVRRAFAKTNLLHATELARAMSCLAAPTVRPTSARRRGSRVANSKRD